MASPKIVRRTTVAGLTLALATLLLAACTTTPAPTPTATATGTSPAPTTSGSGIIADGPSTIGPQPYIRSTIGDGDPALQLDTAAVTDAAAAAYSETELAGALAFAVRFVAENVADTPLINASQEDGLAWLDEHGADLTPGLLDDQRSRFGDGAASDAIVPDLQFLDGDTMIDVVYSQTDPRLIDRVITVGEIDLAADVQALVFEIDLDSTIQATEASGDQRPIRLVIDGHVTLSVVPNGAGWAITAYKQNVHGQAQVKQ